MVVDHKLAQSRVDILMLHSSLRRVRCSCCAGCSRSRCLPEEPLVFGVDEAGLSYPTLLVHGTWYVVGLGTRRLETSRLVPRASM